MTSNWHNTSATSNHANGQEKSLLSKGSTEHAVADSNFELFLVLAKVSSVYLSNVRKLSILS